MIYGFNYKKRGEYTPGFYSIQSAIVADLGVLHYLKDVAPVLDANMFLIYGNENGYDISDFTVKDLMELSALYSRQIRAYVNNKIRNKIIQLLKRWDDAIAKLGLTISLNEPMYRQFISASRNIEQICYDWSNVNTEAVAAVLHSVRNQFIMNSSTYRQMLSEDIPIDPEAVHKFFNYLLDFSRLKIDKRLSDPAQYYQLNKEIIEISVSYLNMLVNSATFSKHFTMYDNPEAIFDSLFAPRFSEQSKEVKEYTRKSRALNMCHVLCLDTTWIDGLIMPRTPIIRDNSSSKFAAMLMMSNSTDTTISQIEKLRTSNCNDNARAVPVEC